MNRRHQHGALIVNKSKNSVSGNSNSSVFRDVQGHEYDVLYCPLCMALHKQRKTNEEKKS